MAELDPLPPLPALGEDPWFQKRAAFDAIVKERLEGYLDPQELDARILSVGGGGGGGGTPSVYGVGPYGTGLYGQGSSGSGGGGAPIDHTHDASDIISGIIATARLGSGAASSGTYLRGDGTWQTPPSSGGGGTVPVVFEHGSNATAIRPSTTAIVVWVGTVQPTNWLDGDQWINATPV